MLDQALTHIGMSKSQEKDQTGWVGLQPLSVHMRAGMGTDWAVAGCNTCQQMPRLGASHAIQGHNTC